MKKLLFLLSFPLTTMFAQTTFVETFTPESSSSNVFSGRQFAQSGERWVANSNISILNKDGQRYAAPTTQMANVARVRLKDAIERITIACRVDLPREGLGEPGWFAIGMGDPDGYNNAWGLGILMILHRNGAIECAYNSGKSGTSGLVRLPSPSGRIEAGERLLRLEYDQVANTATFWVDDLPLLENYPLGEFRPAMKFAGFSFSSPKPDADRVMAFEITTQP